MIVTTGGGAITIQPESVIESVFDSCGIDTVFLSRTEFDCSDFATNPNPITVTARDINGNESTCTTNLIIEDKIPISLTCPSDSSFIACGVDSFAVILPEGNAADNCGIESINYLPASGSSFPIGTTTVTCTATSNTGEMATCTFDVTVLAPQITPVPNRVVCDRDMVQAITFNSNLPNTTFQWTSSADVGFGTSGAGNIPSFTALNTSNSLVTSTLTVTALIDPNGIPNDGDECQETQSSFIEVFSPPVVDVPATRNHCVGDVISEGIFIGDFLNITWTCPCPSNIIGLGSYC